MLLHLLNYEVSLHYQYNGLRNFILSFLKLNIAGMQQPDFEPNGESALYDNFINEEKLANVQKGKVMIEPTASSTSKIQQIINKLTELSINGEATNQSYGRHCNC